jgi:hypothetical protein
MAANQASATDTISAKVAGYGVSYAITSIMSALIVVLKEANPGVHDFLASITGHHWVTHSLLDVIVFVVLGAVLSRSAGMRMSGNSIITIVVGATVISGLIITGYFI